MGKETREGPISHNILSKLKEYRQTITYTNNVDLKMPTCPRLSTIASSSKLKAPGGELAEGPVPRWETGAVNYIVSVPADPISMPQGTWGAFKLRSTVTTLEFN